MENRQFKLRGQNAAEFIEFVACPDISRHTYDISIAFAGYTVCVSSVTVWVGSFLQELAAFEATRTGRAELAGTYDFVMTIERFESRGDALVRFELTHMLILPTLQYGGCHLDGAFVLEGEYVASTLRGMERLFDSYTP